MDQRNAPHVNSLPIELLSITFEMLDVAALTQCLFVCRHWNRVAQHVAELKCLWKNIVTEYIVDSGASTQLKSVGFTWRDCLINQLLWTHINKATISVKPVYSSRMNKNIHVYRDKLIVVHANGVTYFNIRTAHLLRGICMECLDFEETDDYFIKLSKKDRYETLDLYRKQHINDFNINQSNECNKGWVAHYRVVGDRCYVLNSHMARYFGSDCATLGLTVHKDDVFVMLKRGDVMMRATSNHYFEKIMDVPYYNNTATKFVKMFHRIGIVLGVPNNKPFCFKRYDAKVERAFLFICPDVTCVLEHGELLIMGHNDGKVKIYMPRVVSEENVLLFEKHFTEIPEIENKAIVAIDVYEEKGQNHLFVATRSHIAHIVFDHKAMGDYIWCEYPKVSLKLDQPTL